MNFDFNAEIKNTSNLFPKPPKNTADEKKRAKGESE